MKQAQFIILLSISFMLISCNEEQIDWEFDNQKSDLIAIEAVITNELKPHIIKVSTPYAEQNLSPKPVTGANIIIETDDTPSIIYNTTETPAGSGLYITDSMRSLSGKIYTLVINYNATTYYASDIQSQAENLEDTLRYYAVSDSTYALSFNEFGDEPNYIKYYLDWSSNNSCAFSDDCKALQIQYDLKNIAINQLIAPNQEVVDFPLNTVVVRRKYSVSSAYKDYLIGMLSETTYRGGLFDSYPANALSNLSEGAVGFFAVSTVVSDTVVIK
ncbi:MAG: DUF4249 domain-containing protein [Cyclobacteriaceae bacterium]|nr:DUF4249 domain-containing protein [Cyclobacteriaceae bacterium]